MWFYCYWCVFLYRSVRSCLTSLIWTFSIWAWILWRAPAWSLGVLKPSQAFAASSSTAHMCPGLWCTRSHKRSLSKCTSVCAEKPVELSIFNWHPYILPPSLFVCVSADLRSSLVFIDAPNLHVYVCGWENACIYFNYIMLLTIQGVWLFFCICVCQTVCTRMLYISISD